MTEKYAIHLECRNRNYGTTRLYSQEEYDAFLKNLTDAKKDFVGVMSYKDTWYYVQKINIVRVEVTIKKVKDVSTAPEGTEKKEKTATTAKTFEPTKKENKSKKLLLLLKPTVFEKLQAKAQEYSISTNELINQILENNV